MREDINRPTAAHMSSWSQPKAFCSTTSTPFFPLASFLSLYTAGYFGLHTQKVVGSHPDQNKMPVGGTNRAASTTCIAIVMVSHLKTLKSHSMKLRRGKMSSPVLMNSACSAAAVPALHDVQLKALQPDCGAAVVTDALRQLGIRDGAMSQCWTSSQFWMAH